MAILRDEGRFVHEWLACHRLLGVDHFFLYDARLGVETRTAAARIALTAR